MSKIVNAKGVGRSHISSNTPCQDFVTTKKSRKLGISCVALSDGAGSCEMSHFGAEIITKIACNIMTKEFDVLCKSSQKEASKMIIPPIVKALQIRATKDNCFIKQYSGTLLAVALQNKIFVAFHIGDGVIGRVRNGISSIISHPENGEFSNNTYFVTDETAEKRIRLYSDEVKSGDTFFLMSDGTAESLYNKKEENLASACITMAEWIKKFSEKKVSSILNSNIEQVFTKKSSDDCSIAIILSA